MTQPDVSSDHGGNNLDSQEIITIDPLSFFQYASSSKDCWRELIGLTINHCSFGLGTIKKIDGEYIYVDLPDRQEKKHLTEFGLDSFQRGYFTNLQINNALQQRIMVAAAASQEMPPQSETLEAEAPQGLAKKKRKSTKATKKEA
ncbi:MAG: hypothetical protein FJ135_14090 [Deltaproteobacteria bacterium]|nr:hypothetical protein [Deltaproteobacteria bacterium]